MKDDQPQNQELADQLAQRERDRRKRARRASLDSFRDLNARRTEKGLPPVEPVARASSAPPPPPEQTAMKNGSDT